MSAPSLTLYNIESELLQLMDLRDDIAGEVIVTAEGEADRTAQLAACDTAIAEYVKREVLKVDNLCGFLRECTTRAKIAKDEAARISAKAELWKARADRVKQSAAEAMALTLDLNVIAKAPQNTVLKRMNGRTSELKLCKSPSSVSEDIDESLLPAEYQRIQITVSCENFERIVDAMRASGVDFALEASTTVLRGAIGAALKAGKVVPGAKLVEDSVHVRIS